ncbi:protease modulator HflK [Microvirga sp. SRT01]|uniref:Protease modulator HflK n=1 Tax=Sphingomonas longa TaxID=2778730 RepID=A0ABS2D3X9_9SPHN|nr:MULTISPECIES: protease modulator HflK [Alphaproteobacteria]MBM6575614.1 protease modulator HflK [Sphingomonas sp. BT552]MBR7708661.1 protease modulator HflK [Microvirga sp. SRT01]
MSILPRWRKRPTVLAVETPKGPWGGGENSGGGPRNPWSLPPGGKKPAGSNGNGPRPTALDEFLKKARNAGGGGSGGGGFSGLPTGPNARMLWAIGAAILVAIWLVFTSIHQIAPQERGVVTYFGRYAGTLQPGVQITPPAPIARVQTVNVQGFRTENFPRGDGVNLALTKDQNIVDLTYSVRWNIANPSEYVFELREPEETVRAAAESAMRAVIANTTLDQALGRGRTTIESEVSELTQSILNSYRAGVRIQSVSINRASAPQQIVDDFNKVTAAQQEAVAAVNRSRAYAQQVVARAQGEAAAFDRVYAQYKLAPEVTRRRMYYETMEDVLAKSNKTIVEPGGTVPYLQVPGATRAPAPAAVVAAPAPAPAQPAATTGAGQ